MPPYLKKALNSYALLASAEATRLTACVHDFDEVTPFLYDEDGKPLSPSVMKQRGFPFLLDIIRVHPTTSVHCLLSRQFCDVPFSSPVGVRLEGPSL